LSIFVCRRAWVAGTERRLVLFVELIRKKRDGLELSCEEIAWVIAAGSRGEPPDSNSLMDCCKF
jgi:hypothetical protein